MKCRELIIHLEKLAPQSLAESWDNPGLIVGRTEGEIQKVLVALDVTSAVIDEAIELGADMIVTHHPLIFGGVKQITDETPLGDKLLRLISNNIAHFALHTNLDVAFGGTNDCLGDILGLKDLEVLSVTEESDGVVFGLGRIGTLEKEASLGEIASTLKKALNLDTIRFVGEADTTVRKIGLCTGSGIEFLKDAQKKGAQCYVTSDIRYHESQKALDMGMCVIDATHYASENIIVPVISRFLENLNAGLIVNQSRVDGQVFKHI